MLAFSLLGGPPAVRLLGNTPVAFRRSHALRGLGDYNSDTPCSMIAAGDPYRSPGNYCTQPSGNVTEFNADGSVDSDPFATSSGGSSSGGSSSGGSSSSGGTPWYSSLATGLVRGLVTPSATTVIPLAPVQPWYTQWWGIGAILALGVGTYVMLKPAPARATAGVSGARKRRRN